MNRARQRGRSRGKMSHTMVYDPTTNFLNVHEWAYGVTECVHIASFALSIGTIATVDLRLLGVGIGRTTASGLARDLAPWTLSGLIIVVLTGLLIFSTDPLRYYHHPTFRLKMACLLAGIVYNYTVHLIAVRKTGSRAFGAVAAAASLAIWITVVFCGLFYAFT